MIEISQVDEDDKLYIDFGYKGLPPDLMIQKITIRDNPTIEVKDDVQTHELDTSVSEALKEGDSVKLDIKLDSMIEIVDVPEEEYRYLIEEQTNDLFENVPLDTERGYHIHFKDCEHLISRPVVFSNRGFGMTPMEQGLRVVGTVEFGGLKNAFCIQFIIIIHLGFL